MRRRAVGDLGVDVHDAAVAPCLHAGHDVAAEEHRAADEVVELREVVVPPDVEERDVRLRAGGVDHEDVDRAQAVGHRSGECFHRGAVGDVGAEGRSHATVGTDRAHHGRELVIVVEAVDGDDQPVPGQPPGDDRAQAA